MEICKLRNSKFERLYVFQNSSCENILWKLVNFRCLNLHSRRFEMCARVRRSIRLLSMHCQLQCVGIFWRLKPFKTCFSMNKRNNIKHEIHLSDHSLERTLLILKSFKKMIAFYYSQEIIYVTPTLYESMFFCPPWSLEYIILAIAVFLQLKSIQMTIDQYFRISFIWFSNSISNSALVYQVMFLLYSL